MKFNQETKHQLRQVLIEEYYTKEDDIVYWHWRFNGGEWNKKISPFNEIPWIEVEATPELIDLTQTLEKVKDSEPRKFKQGYGIKFKKKR